MARTTLGKMCRNTIWSMIWITSVMVSVAYCQNHESNDQNIERRLPAVQQIESEQQFYKILESSGKRLVMVDFFADWCSPCKILSPILEDIARQVPDTVSLYKLDVDKHPQIASRYKISGIPVVIFFRDNTAIYRMYGLQPKKRYLNIIRKLGETPDNPAGGSL